MKKYLLLVPAGLALVCLYIPYSIALIYAVYLGIDFYLGTIWAVVVMFILTLPGFRFLLLVAAVLGAVKVWQWHWAIAVVFAVPGLAVFIPAIAVGIVAAFERALNSLSID